MSRSLGQLLCGTAGALLILGLAPALALSRRFDIPEQYASQSLPEFARQAGVQIVAPGDQLRDVKTPAVKGILSVDQALAILINGTGLEVAQNSGSTIVLRRPEHVAEVSPPLPPTKRADEPAAATEAVIVTGSRLFPTSPNLPRLLPSRPKISCRPQAPTISPAP